MSDIDVSTVGEELINQISTLANEITVTCQNNFTTPPPLDTSINSVEFGYDFNFPTPLLQSSLAASHYECEYDTCRQ